MKGAPWRGPSKAPAAPSEVPGQGVRPPPWAGAHRGRSAGRGAGSRVCRSTGSCPRCSCTSAGRGSPGTRRCLGGSTLRESAPRPASQHPRRTSAGHSAPAQAAGCPHASPASPASSGRAPLPLLRSSACLEPIRPENSYADLNTRFPGHLHCRCLDPALTRPPSLWVCPPPPARAGWFCPALGSATLRIQLTPRAQDGSCRPQFPP